jgi:hypothetical protein
MEWTMLWGWITARTAGDGHREEPPGLDHLQTLVHQRGAVQRDLAAHGPGGVLQGLRGGDVLQVAPLAPAERPARGGEDDLADVSGPVSPQALVDRAVLAVDRQETHSLGLDERHHDLAGGDQHLLAGEGDLLAGLDGRDRGSQPDHSRHADDHEVGLRQGGELHQRLHPRRNLRVRVEQRQLGFGELRALAEQKLGVRAGGQADHLQPVGMLPDDVERLAADAARGAENDDPLHRGILGERQLLALV